MIKCFIFLGLFVSLLYFVKCQGGSMLGPGEWKTKMVKRCEDDEYINDVNIVRRKLNRTHDAFTIDLDLTMPIDDNVAILIDAYKMVDGGQWKQYQVMSDDSTPRFVNKYAQSNAERALTMAGMDPPEFPIPPGKFHIEDYVFDYSELPVEGVFGEYLVYAYLLLGDVRVGCVCAVFEFIKDDD